MSPAARVAAGTRGSRVRRSEGYFAGTNSSAAEFMQ